MNNDDAEQKYKEIINLSRPEDPAIFRKHPRMPVSERAKIFSPFAALRGYDEHLEEEKERINQQKRADVSEDESARLSEQLAQLAKGMTVSVEYFHPDYPNAAHGVCKKIQGTVSAIDSAAHTLRIEEVSISFEDLVKIELLPNDFTDKR